MIISKTPFRISIFGGSTDYPSYYMKHGSLLVGFTIDKYCYLSVKKTPKIFNYKTAVSYSRLEKVSKNSDIQHNGVRGVLQYFNIRYGLEINHLCDLPSQTGIGSSSSFIVGLINSISSLRNKDVSKNYLANTAIEIERNLLGEPGGIQDQIWAAYGGINSIHIRPDGSFEVRPMPISEKFKTSFLDRLALIYTGKTRRSFGIAEAHNDKKNHSAKRKIQSIAELGYNALADQDIDSVGQLLDESWRAKKNISDLISSDCIESLYSELKDNGMIGGKLLGSGGSGFILCVLKQGAQKGFNKRFDKLLTDFNFSESGSQIINRD